MSNAPRLLSVAALLAGAVLPGCFLIPEDGPPRESDLPSATAKQVVGGRLHACALTTAGGVRCWGYGEYGGLGDGTDFTAIEDFDTYRRMAVQVVGLESGVEAIATDADADFTCALRTGGTVACWGDNTWGQLGDGTTTLAWAPVDVVGVSGATAISVGGAHACALLADRTITCWGSNSDGELGNGVDGEDIFEPVAIPVPGLTDVTQVEAMGQHTCAVSSGALWCWGHNIAGECGVSDDTWEVLTPTAVPSLATGVARVRGGWKNTCALMTSGGVKCWGDNEYGQLGDGSGGGIFEQSDVPLDVVGLASGVTDLRTGTVSSIVIAGGRVKTWGTFRAGIADAAPVDAPELPEAATQVTTGGGDGTYACAITTSGAVYCWGDNESGTVGFYDNDLGVHYEEEPKAISSLP
jgi:alpha-tubulin suppressor-like RCC1 family protein